MTEKKRTSRAKPKEQKSKQQFKTLVFRDGRTYRVLKEQGKYYICEGTQFRKSNTNIVEVRIDPERT